jgi:hypothetical protein
MPTALRAALAAGLAAACIAAGAAAQVPPHPPGTICFTPKFWCWAATPGRPGEPCACGDVPGVLG